MVIEACKLFIQNFHLRNGDLQSTAVQMVDPHHALRQFLLVTGDVIGQTDMLELQLIGFFNHHGEKRPP